MILVEADINGTTHYVADRYKALTHQWKGFLENFSSITFGTRQDYGGYADISYGTMNLIPNLFSASGDWPPPMEINITVKWLATDVSNVSESNAVTYFVGKAYRSKITTTGVEYRLYHDNDYTAKVTNGTAYNDTLVDVMTTLCGASYLNLTLDSTLALSPSPNVHFTTSGEKLAIDLASEICAFYKHCFYIESGTLYLIDMDTDNGTLSLPFYHFMESNVSDFAPIAELSISGEDTWTPVTTSYPYGEKKSFQKYHDTEANATSALNDILTILQKPQGYVKIPLGKLGSDIPVIGEKVTWTDNDLYTGLNISIRTRRIVFNLMDGYCEIIGEGDVAVGTPVVFGTDRVVFGTDEVRF